MEKIMENTAKKQFSRLGLMFFLGTLIIYAAQLIPMTIVQLVKPEWLDNPDISLILSVLPLYLVGMPLLILLVKKGVPAEQIERHSISGGKFAVAAIMCFGLVYLTNIIANVMTFFIGLIKGNVVNNVIANVAMSVSIWLVVLYMVLIAPFMEEYVFRKLIVDRTVKYGQGVAVLMSGLMFGLFHGNLNQFVYAFALGSFLAFLYVKTGNLKITIALHMMINFMGGVVSVLALKGLDMEAYQEAFLSGDTALITAYLGGHLGGLLLYGIYLFFVVGMIIAGGVLIIIALAKKRFVLEPGQEALPAGKGFSTLLLNPGMILYCIFWISMIIWQLLA